MRTLPLVLLLVLGSGACRGSCGESASSDASAPRGMPAPVSSLAAPRITGSARPAPIDLADLRLSRGKKGGEYTEFQVARAGDTPARAAFERWQAGSDYLGIAATAFFHPAFARAHPGFDLVLPRLLGPEQLRVLSRALGELSPEILAVSDLATARARWKHAQLLEELGRDDEWPAVRSALAGTAKELAALAEAHAARGESLWVLGL